MSQLSLHLTASPMIDLATAVPTRTHGLILAGVAIIVAFAGAFGAWSWFAPLAVGAHATGVVKVETDRKRVQHLEGGIIREILVKDGDHVTAGQPLVRLDDTRYRATLNILTANYLNALAMASRLEAEQRQVPAIELPPQLREQAGDPKVAAMLDSQQQLFQARRSSLDGQLAELRERVVQARAEIRALEGTMQAQARQERGFRDEIGTVESLIASGHERRPRLLTLQRSLAGTEAGRSSAGAEIAKARQKIAESEQMIAQLNGAFINDVASQLRQQQGQLFELSDRIAVARDAVQRLEITAPRDGTVLGLRFFASGAVVAPGETVLEIVPADDKLIIEARLPPQQIERIVPGLSARVRLLPYSMRRTPLFDGTVTTVSADTVRETIPGVQSSGLHYTVKIELDSAALARAPEVRLQAGMPADVLIDVGERSLAEYLLEPIMFGIRRALREH